MEEENRELTEYKNRELKDREAYSLSTEVQREEYDISIEEELNLKDYIDVLIRRKWIVISCLVVSVITVAIASLMMNQVYKAEATIEIAPENPKIITFQEVLEVEARQTEFYETQYKLIKNKSLAKEVVHTLKLDSHPEFAMEEEKKPGFISLVKDTIAEIFSVNNGLDPREIEKERLAREEGLINSFLARVNIIPDRKSQLVQVSFESTDPELSAKAVNILVDKYIEWIVERKLDATKAARGFLEKQLEQVKAKLERAEEELSAFAKTADIVSLDGNLNLIYKQLAELNKALSKAETGRLSKEALYQEVRSGNNAYLPQAMNDPSIQALSEEYTKLKSQYDNISVIYGPNYPDMKQLAAQLGRIQSDINQRISGIAESIKKDYQAALTKENIFRQRTEEQKKRTSELNEKTIQYKILEREVDTNKSIYQNLLQRLKETEVTSGIRATNVQVVDYASTPLMPYKPNIRLNVLLAVLMGLMGGIFLSFTLEHFDSTIKDEDDVKRRFSLPFLGVVPFVSENEIQGIEKVVHINPKSIISEAFRVIRTSIMYSSSDGPPRSLLVTSSQPIEGKTTCASNLALSMIQSGLKVILVDADLRKPRLHKIFLKNGNAFGLSTYLVGKMELPGVINRTDINGFCVIPSGPIPPNPAELLGSKRMRELIERLLEEYDHVILDGPPIMGFADSRLLSRLVDGTLLVTSVGITQRKALRNSIDEILRVRGRIIGTIVNRLESRRSKYGYGYYYYYSDEKSKEGKRLPRSSRS
ncbi:MAG: polysaccharide biosynthesis tyrosine autokinase [Deltaproteobacteria bacterium]|nr:polysaccharide biosynthesis tyrosine autokinase [Deltaproteobacteria bacterium]